METSFSKFIFVWYKAKIIGHLLKSVSRSLGKITVKARHRELKIAVVISRRGRDFLNFRTLSC